MQERSNDDAKIAKHLVRIIWKHDCRGQRGKVGKKEEVEKLKKEPSRICNGFYKDRNKSKDFVNSQPGFGPLVKNYPSRTYTLVAK